MVRSHKFCCCLPVRLGVFVLSCVELLLSGVVAGALWYGLFSKSANVHISGPERISAIFLAIGLSCLALTALFGFIGSMIRKQSYVSAFSQTLNWLLGYSIGMGIVYLVLLFTESKQTFINRCIDGSADQNVIKTCNHVTTLRFVVLGIIIANWIIHLYMCIIVARYVVQLQEEDEDRYRRFSVTSQKIAPYGYESQGRASAEYLTHPEDLQSHQPPV